MGIHIHVPWKSDFILINKILAEFQLVCSLSQALRVSMEEQRARQEEEARKVAEQSAAEVPAPAAGEGKTAVWGTILQMGVELIIQNSLNFLCVWKNVTQLQGEFSSRSKTRFHKIWIWGSQTICEIVSCLVMVQFTTSRKKESYFVKPFSAFPLCFPRMLPNVPIAGNTSRLFSVI